MSSYDENTAAAIAKITVRPCRGPRKPFLPFCGEEAALLAALMRAELAYDNAVGFEEEADRCSVLEGIRKEQQLFSNRLDALKRCWNNLSTYAKLDLAHALEYQSSLKALGDDEEALAVRDILPNDKLVSQFESKIVDLQQTIPTYVIEVDPSKKKDLKKNGISRMPLREFAYEMKLFWDQSMKSKFGPDSGKVVPFSVAGQIIAAAVKILTKVYTTADFDWIMRDIQKSNYDRNEFLPRPLQDSGLLAILKPHLAEVPLSGSTAKYRLARG